MRLHTNTLTEAHIHEAARGAGVTLEHLGCHGSRKRAHAFEVALSGSGVTGGQWGGGGYKSATWDEWGIFLGELYRADQDMIAGSAYRNAEHFQWVTGARFDDLTPSGQHLRHRWDLTGKSCTGAYWVYDCKGCDAHRRDVAAGWTWNAIHELV
jgi:hypothetical protein